MRRRLSAQGVLPCLTLPRRARSCTGLLQRRGLLRRPLRSTKRQRFLPALREIAIRTRLTLPATALRPRQRNAIARPWTRRPPWRRAVRPWREMLARGGREASHEFPALKCATRPQAASTTVSGPSVLTFSCTSQVTPARAVLMVIV